MHTQLSDITAIHERNKRVEMDKAWETSKTRRFVIAVITYIVACVWLYIIDESFWYYKALVPVAGFILSTITLPPLKAWWIKKHY